MAPEYIKTITTVIAPISTMLFAIINAVTDKKKKHTRVVNGREVTIEKYTRWGILSIVGIVISAFITLSGLLIDRQIAEKATMSNKIKELRDSIKIDSIKLNTVLINENSRLIYDSLESSLTTARMINMRLSQNLQLSDAFNEKLSDDLLLSQALNSKVEHTSSVLNKSMAAQLSAIAKQDSLLSKNNLLLNPLFPIELDAEIFLAWECLEKDDVNKIINFLLVANWNMHQTTHRHKVPKINHKKKVLNWLKEDYSYTLYNLINEDVKERPCISAFRDYVHYNILPRIIIRAYSQGEDFNGKGSLLTIYGDDNHFKYDFEISHEGLYFYIRSTMNHIHNRSGTISTLSIANGNFKTEIIPHLKNKYVGSYTAEIYLQSPTKSYEIIVDDSTKNCRDSTHLYYIHPIMEL